MNIEHLSEQLALLLNNITVRWDELRAVWDDAVRADFEHHYIDPLQAEVEGVRQVMDDLGAAVEHGRNVIADG
jgi:hypothetical protein